MLNDLREFDVGRPGHLRLSAEMNSPSLCAMRRVAPWRMASAGGKLKSRKSIIMKTMLGLFWLFVCRACARIFSPGSNVRSVSGNEGKNRARFVRVIVEIIWAAVEAARDSISLMTFGGHLPRGVA